MQLWDYHTHNYRCGHAEGHIEEYIQAGIAANLAEIGISDHFPMELLPEEANVWKYAMKKNEFPNYLTEIVQLKEKYKNQIDVKIASEVDYYKPSFSLYRKAVSQYLEKMDYILGSVHVIGPWEGTTAFGVDDDIALEKCQSFGADKIYLEYYDNLADMVTTGFYNIIGHFDLPKKYGVRPDHPEIIFEKILKILDLVKASEMSIEINTAGLIKPVKEQYPSFEILQEIIQRDIPINFGSDSHKPNHIAYAFNEIFPQLKKMGLKKICQWKNREQKLITIQ